MAPGCRPSTGPSSGPQMTSATSAEKTKACLLQRTACPWLTLSLLPPRAEARCSPTATVVHPGWRMAWTLTQVGVSGRGCTGARDSRVAVPGNPFVQPQACVCLGLTRLQAALKHTSAGITAGWLRTACLPPSSWHWCGLILGRPLPAARALRRCSLYRIAAGVRRRCYYRGWLWGWCIRH